MPTLEPFHVFDVETIPDDGVAFMPRGFATADMLRDANAGVDAVGVYVIPKAIDFDLVVPSWMTAPRDSEWRESGCGGFWLVPAYEK